MQDFLGSVRRSMVFRTTADEDNRENHPPLSGALADKITSCIRKSRVFIKPYSLSPSPPPPASLPATVDMASTIRWRKGQLIGRGAFGTVYMGMNLDSGELLAVKQVLIAAKCATKGKAQTHVQELEEEVKLLKNLSHPNIVRYLGTVREDETLNILLEFVSGGSISSLLEKFGAFPEPVVRTYTEQLLLGLEYLHNHGIMHRDIKGANILVDNKGCIKLADFGASKQVAELATISGAKSMKGTPYWMAPEVIRQTGHSFSADIWSVGCTVIEMVTGKAPWSQQYKEVAAIFHIGTTKAHPPIPESLSADAKDFLLKCLQEEPNLRPTASELLKHPFVTGKQRDSASAVLASIMENSSTPPPSQLMKSSTMSTCDDAGDICNLGSLNCSFLSLEPSIQSDNLWQKNNNDDEDDDDMCLIDCENFLTFDAEASHALEKKNDIEKSCDAMKDISDGFKCKFDGSPGNGEREYNMSVEVDQPSYSEEDDELTESKIKAFLDEKAAELKKLQTPLYEEFYNSLITSSPNYMESNSNSNKREDTPHSFLKLPPKSRSPGRGPLGGSPPSRATDTSGISKSPGSSGSPGVCNMHNASDEAAQEGITLSEIERKWKEELNQELERKRREIMRQAGIGSSPRDRSLSRQREKSRFASPGK
ncbi:PREDICTED: LOW QUALITY PROTEIN: mitogen-activated protein kinase kinase kinase ANP1 [Tarenaya hassleriana]|uniref:LOW QUALITY PROTEIN: mitogen-activated protein kinase kinase kinase ANP1 n=1 Tax=Tarenaya hassleriana TaxID=28532 RepID=UPI00053C5D90|nr:PREDICTED: LOW QUALITY PROTEIN: mitogen-activated protein kinase kinase kinase ANP1 [Tarenaya hassleriana]